MAFPTARAAAADHFRRRWGAYDPAYADPNNTDCYIADDDHNLMIVNEDENPERWMLYGSFDGTIYCTVKKKKDGTFWCPATSMIR